MKFALRSASGAALLLGMVGSAWGQTVATTQTDAQAQAQATTTTGAAAPQQEATDKVVITGSLIAQSAEDAPLPVDVYSMEDLKDQGAPSVQEFARSLSQSGETSGEFSILTGAGNAGTSNVSLRGLGAARTMTLLNGRRSSENTNYIPMMALSRVEVLKDGAGVTYGAGAVAGVVNFVTRRDVDGIELDYQNKMYQGSSGEQVYSLLTGWVGDSSNFLLGMTYERQGNLPMTARPELQYSYNEQPIQYTGGTTTAPNPGTYFLTPGANTAVRDFNQASCQQLGGTSRTASATPECYYNFTPFYDLLNKEKDFRVYAEYNSDLNDTMEFHVEGAYAKADSPEVMFSPAGNPVPSHRAVIGSSTTGTGATITSFSTSTNKMFQIPVVNDDWNGAVAGGGVRNPFIDKFYNDLRLRYGTAVAGASNPTSGSVYTGNSWRPFSQGGNPLFGYQGRYQRSYRDFYQFSSSLEGDFTEGWLGLLSGLHYKNSVSLDNSTAKTFLPDIITSRLQNAMRGYGGPDCAAVDRIATDYTSVASYDATVGIQDTQWIPGTNGCQWFNPFASAYEKNVFTGETNSLSYGGPGYANSYELVDWLHEDQGSEVQTTNFTANSVLSGLTPLTLPGGEIAFALGTEWRYEQVRNRVLGDDDLRQLSREQCVWGDQVLGQTVGGTVFLGSSPPICSLDEPGPWYEYGDQIDYDTLEERRSFAGYTELQIPVFDNLNFQLGGRYESFDGNIGKIWKAAGKWDILPDLSVRASVGTNYVAPPVGLRPNYASTGVTFDATFLNIVPTTYFTQAGIFPEQSRNRNIGISWAPSIGDNNFRFALDYFDIDDQDQIVTTGLRVLLNQVAPTSATFTTVVAGVPTTITQLDSGRNVATARLDCDAPLIAFFTLNTTCTPGVTNMGNVTDIRLTTLNGPGQSTAGVDFSFNYDRPLFGGTLMASMSGTQVNKYEIQGYQVNGVTIESSGSRLGYNNNSRSGEFSSKLRGNASIAWSGFGHSFRLQANHVKGVFDELGCTTVVTPPGGAAVPSACGGTGYSTNGLSPTGSGVPSKVKDYTDYDFHWRFAPDYMKDLELRLSILNFLDVAPPRDVRARDGYLTQIAPDGARGRQFEVGLTKRF